MERLVSAVTCFLLSLTFKHCSLIVLQTTVSNTRYSMAWSGVIFKLSQISLLWSMSMQFVANVDKAVARHLDTTHTQHNHFTTLFPGPPRWAGTRRELLDFMVQGKINRGIHTDHPAGRHFIWTNHLHHPPVFYRPDALPAAQATASKHWRKALHIDTVSVFGCCHTGEPALNHFPSVSSSICSGRKLWDEWHKFLPFGWSCVLDAQCESTNRKWAHWFQPGNSSLLHLPMYFCENGCWSLDCSFQVPLPIPDTHTTMSRPFFRDYPDDLVPKEIFWSLWCKGGYQRQTHWQSGWTLISDPSPLPPAFLCMCNNPSNLCWLGTGTKYVGWYTQWLG